MSKNSNVVTVNEQDLTTVVNTVLELMKEHQIFYAHVRAIEDRWNKAEERFFERIGPLENSIRHSEERVADLAERVYKLEGVTPDEVIRIAEQAAEQIAKRIVDEHLRQAFTLTQQSPFTPQLHEAMAAIQKRMTEAQQ